MKAKSEVFEKFKEFKALIENLSDKKIKTLRSDNGGEYTLKEFEAFCKDVGIKRELTNPYCYLLNKLIFNRSTQTIYFLHSDEDFSAYYERFLGD